jgi:release factor glutamine methyltransferase
MNIGNFLSQASAALRGAGIESARLDVLLLLEDELGMDRSRLLAHPEITLSPTALRRLNKKCVQRKVHLPLAYIRGTTFFYGRAFYVDTNVLVPRPESEAMISLLLTAKHIPAKPLILDIGTGSGCLGITAALEMPSAKVTLRDISRPALAVAKRNAKQHRVAARVILEQADLLTDAPYADAILANLPYVPAKYPVNAAARHEPVLALFAGDDGMDLYRAFWDQVTTFYDGQPPAAIITEAFEDQHSEMAGLATAAGYQLSRTEGLAQLFTPAHS